MTRRFTCLLRFCAQFGTHRLLERALGEDISELGRISALPGPDDLQKYLVPIVPVAFFFSSQQRVNAVH